MMERTEQYLKQAALAARSWYDANGRWRHTTPPAETRERYWICFALYASGNASLADAIIMDGRIDRSHVGTESTSSFDIFHSNIACVLLLRHSGRMSAAVQEKLTGLVRDSLAFQPGNRRPDYQFHGYNDNMPAKATMGLILGGEMLGDAQAVAHGVWNLRQLRGMLMRRGTHSEWNSPTYSPLTIHAIAEIAAHVRDAEARELALAIEERLWLDLAARFHPDLGMLAGPYSRAYTVDLVGHTSAVASLLWFVLGDIARPSPMNLFNTGPAGLLHHMRDVPFNIAQMCWLAAGVYQVPDRARVMFAHKGYPFHAMATAEMGDCGPDLPARPARLETFLQADYAVGTSSTSFLNLVQSASYFVNYKRAAEVRSLADRATIFHKITVDDEGPGTVRSPLGPDGRPYPNSGEEDNLQSWANTWALQHDSSVLLVSHPHLSLGGLEEKQTAKAVTRVSEMVIFSAHYGGADEIRVGNQPRDQWDGDVALGEWMGCRRGRLLIAIRPLMRVHGGASITLEKINHYEVLRASFYQGESRVFTRAELRNMGGGFVAEHASVDDYPSLAAFMETLAAATVRDYFYSTRRVVYTRHADARTPALEFEISWSPGSMIPRYATINGRAPSAEPPVQIDGIGAKDFPFLTDEWKPQSDYFPWPAGMV